MPSLASGRYSIESDPASDALALIQPDSTAARTVDRDRDGRQQAQADEDRDNKSDTTCATQA